MKQHKRLLDERKARQFCHQVQRALNVALEESYAAEGVSGLYVDDVTPAPDCGRLLVHVMVPEGCPVAAAMDALRKDASRLRAEVALSITRKRAPELCFAPVCLEGANDE